MSIGQALIPEFEQEMATTRRVLARVPSDNGQWKPHPKSFSLGHLAQLVSWLPGWVGVTLNTDSLDLAKAAGYTYESTDTLLKGFDDGVRQSLAALSAVPDPVFDKTWKLVRGDVVLWAAPVKVVVRNHISHIVHHRAQLGVYLRLLDIPVPAMYGPSADERSF